MTDASTSSNLVSDLREAATSGRGNGGHRDLCGLAASEIERQRREILHLEGMLASVLRPAVVETTDVWICPNILKGRAGDPCPHCGNGPCPVIAEAKPSEGMATVTEKQIAPDRSHLVWPSCGVRLQMRQVETTAPHRCRAMDLAGELRRYFDSGTLDEASDLYLLLKEVEAMRPVEPEARPCTCHPDDNPPRPCPHRYALSECRKAAEYREQVNSLSLECAQSTRKSVEAIRASENGDGDAKI